MGVLDDAHRDGVVVGLANETNKPITRQDIDSMLLNRPDTFNLMAVALLELMSVENLPWKTPEHEKITGQDKFSWLEIAGIHGLPYRPWDGVGANPDDERDPEKRKKYGYCRHATPAFEVWHRPYLAMLEQALYQQVAKVANRFAIAEHRDRYLDAAKQFRLPYIDYYRPRGYQRMIPGVTDHDDPVGKGIGGPFPRWRGTNKMIRIPYDFSLPQIFTLPKIMVKTPPNDEFRMTQNPFFSFKFPEAFLDDLEWKESELDLSVPGIKDRTMRYGSNKPRSVAQMNDNLCKIHEDQLRMTLTLLDRDGPYKDFAAVTTSGAEDIPKNFSSEQGLSQSPMGSLEAVHDDFHVYYGGFVGTRMGKGKFMKDPKNLSEPLPPDHFQRPDTWAGHMTSVPMAAYDPIFWIHHVQIDRLFAIWQAIHPETWFEDLATEKDRNLAHIDLLPFRASKTVDKEIFWTPNDVRDWERFGYTYPDFETEDRTPEGLQKKFHYLYAWSRRVKPGVKVGVHQLCPPEMEPLDVSKAQVFQFDSGSTEEYLVEKLGPKHDPKRYAKSLGLESLDVSKEIENESSYAWFIDDAVERLAHNGSFTIFYIIDVDGTAGDTGANWVKLPGFVGLTHIFTAAADVCDNCSKQQAEKKIVTSTTPITSLLLDYVETGNLKSMRPEHVGSFLVSHLKWRIQTVKGEVIDPRRMSSEKQLRISVSHIETPPNSNEVSSTSAGDADRPTVSHPEIIAEIISNANKQASQDRRQVVKNCCRAKL